MLEASRLRLGGASSSGKKNKSQSRERTKEKFLSITPDDLWSLQKILSNKKRSLSHTFLEKTEANAKVYDPNEKTMQALESLAVVYAAFEEAGEPLNKELGVRLAESQAAMEEFNVAQQNQERVREVLYDAQESLATALMDTRESMSKITVSQDLHDLRVGDAGTKFNEAKGKADDA